MDGEAFPRPARNWSDAQIRLTTAGSVDDGKSSLIGRLLLDSKALMRDEAAALGGDDDGIDLAAVTDGLEAERAQGITIDVAYRYFATPGASFIIADAPGHEQYTRNMVTAASVSDVALIVIDVTGVSGGVLKPQTRRHAAIAALMGLNIVIAVNKMDLVDWSQERFDEIKAEFRAFAMKLEVQDLSFVPISALHGDNVVTRSGNTPWYEGAPLLHHLEEVHIASDRNLIDARLPVQYVIRPMSDEHHDYRGYAGTVAGGVLKPGDQVVVLPSGFTSTIAAIDTADGPVEEAFAPMAVTVRLTDDVDVSRGDMICRDRNRPHVGQDLEAMVCWLTAETQLRAGAKLAIKHTTRWGRALVKDLQYRLDVNTLHRDEQSEALTLNEIGRVRLRTTVPLFFDEYRRNRTTGSFVLVDEVTNDTVGAGMIIGPTDIP